MPRYLNESEHSFTGLANIKVGTWAPRSDFPEFPFQKWTTSDFAVLMVRRLALAWTTSLLSMVCMASGALASRVR